MERTPTANQPCRPVRAGFVVVRIQTVREVQVDAIDAALFFLTALLLVAQALAAALARMLEDVSHE